MDSLFSDSPIFVANTPFSEKVDRQAVVDDIIGRGKVGVEVESGVEEKGKV